jgi:iron complex outermembrane receptor protein
VNATFTEGPNAGREMVLVPKNVLTARLTWLPGMARAPTSARSGSTASATAATSTTAAPPHAVLRDFRRALRRQAGPVGSRRSGLNLADRRYFSNAFGCQSGIYPSDGRQLKLSARYDF